MLSGVDWDTTTSDIRDIAKLNNTAQFIRIEHGQFKNIGVSKNCQPFLYRDVLYHSARSIKKALAVAVKVRDQKKATVTDINLSIPSTYSGWFEVLSEDGKSIKPLDTVRELAARFPDSCLVRSDIKAFLPNERGELHMSNTQMVNAGELIDLVGDVTIPHQTRARSGIKLLRCRDSKGVTLFLHYDQKGQFSPVAKKDNINGVHNMASLMENFRWPMTVRIVYGVTPSGVNKSKLTNCFRLMAIESDQVAFIMPVTLREKMVPVSLSRIPMKVKAALNMDTIQGTESYKQLHYRCSNMISSYLSSIHIRVDLPPGVYKAKPSQQFYFGMQQLSQQLEQQNDGKRKASPSPVGERNSVPAPKTTRGDKKTKTEEDLIFEEIDDIYVYVRDGGEPPAPRKLPPAEKDELDGEWEEPAYETLGRYQKRADSKTIRIGPETGSKVRTGTDSQSSGHGSSESSPASSGSTNGNHTLITQINVSDRQRKSSASPSASSPPSSLSREDKSSSSRPSCQRTPGHIRAQSMDVGRKFNQGRASNINNNINRVRGRRHSSENTEFPHTKRPPVMFLEMTKSSDGVLVMGLSHPGNMSEPSPPPLPPKLFKRTTSTPLLTNLQTISDLPPGLTKSLSQQNINEEIMFVPPYRRTNFNNVMNEAVASCEESDRTVRNNVTPPAKSKTPLRTRTGALENLRRKVKSMYTT